MTGTRSDGEPNAVVLFDGVCNLCNGAVTFIIDRDPDAYFRFAPLQSEAGGARLEPEHRDLVHKDLQHGDALESIVLLENGQHFTRSTAALRIARRLRGVWPLYAFIVVPRPVRDRVYRWIARNRYRWFGKTDACRLPTPELARRFL